MHAERAVGEGDRALAASDGGEQRGERHRLAAEVHRAGEVEPVHARAHAQRRGAAGAHAARVERHRPPVGGERRGERGGALARQLVRRIGRAPRAAALEPRVRRRLGARVAVHEPAGGRRRPVVAVAIGGARILGGDERARRVGGHAHAVVVEGERRRHPVGARAARRRTEGEHRARRDAHRRDAQLGRHRHRRQVRVQRGQLGDDERRVGQRRLEHVPGAQGAREPLGAAQGAARRAHRRHHVDDHRGPPPAHRRRHVAQQHQPAGDERRRVERQPLDLVRRRAVGRRVLVGIRVRVRRLARQRPGDAHAVARARLERQGERPRRAVVPGERQRLEQRRQAHEAAAGVAHPAQRGAVRRRGHGEAARPHRARRVAHLARRVEVRRGLARAEQHLRDLAVVGIGHGQPLGLAEGEALGPAPRAVAPLRLRGHLDDERRRRVGRGGHVDDVGDAAPRGPLGGGRRGGRRRLVARHRRRRGGPAQRHAPVGHRRPGRAARVPLRRRAADERRAARARLEHRRPQVLARGRVLVHVRAAAVERHRAAPGAGERHAVGVRAAHLRHQPRVARLDDAHAALPPVRLAARAHVGRELVGEVAEDGRHSPEV
jgi:hypothetical protein